MVTDRAASGIVVGVDGSAAADVALRWAVRTAALRRERVLAVTAWTRPPVPVGVSGMVVMESPEPYHAMAKRVLDDAVREADEELSADDRVDIERHVREGSAGRVLVDLAESASALVVGGHGTGLRHHLLGSTVSYCLRHGTVPVVVVREESPVDAARVVVGVDGSESSFRALRWAADEAERRQLPVVVVRAWTLTSVPSPERDRLGYVPPLEEWGRTAAEEAQGWVDRTLGARASLVSEVVEVHGSAARSLLDLLAPDDLLVLGSRGRGGFRGLLLGGVSQQVVEHAPCPVVVIRSAG